MLRDAWTCFEQPFRDHPSLIGRAEEQSTSEIAGTHAIGQAAQGPTDPRSCKFGSLSGDRVRPVFPSFSFNPPARGHGTGLYILRRASFQKLSKPDSKPGGLPSSAQRGWGTRSAIPDHNLVDAKEMVRAFALSLQHRNEKGQTCG